MPAEGVSLFILAGEPSGDRLGAALVAALRKRTTVELAGVGGPALGKQGLRSLYRMSDLSVMGFSDVVKRLPLLLWRARQTVRAILRLKPDVVVLVDAQVLSATIAKRLRRAGYRGRVLLLVAPAVWAWKPERALQLKPLFDEVLAVLPFEPEVMVRLGGPPTSYVGHPALERFPLRSKLPRRGPLLLLPGSRAGEIRRNLPLMRAVAEAAKGHPRVTSLVLPTPPPLRASLVAATADWGVPVEVVASEAQTLKAFTKAVAAVAVTGTVTLELALAGVPMVATYVADAGQARHFARYKVRFVALPNIILDREIVPELLFTTPEPSRLAEAVLSLLDDPNVGAAQFAAFAELRARMEQGTPAAPLAEAAKRVLAGLETSQRSLIGR